MEDRYFFKAKNAITGEWVTWSILSGLYGINFSPDTICQCTGLKDKNGNLIWENDIVKGHRASFGVHRHIGKVKYINGRYDIIGVKQYIEFSDALNSSYEVIGNIFDNPKLLESEEK